MENMQQLFESINYGSTVMSLSPWELVLVGTVLISWVALFLSLVNTGRIQKQSASIQQQIAQLNRDLLIAGNGAIGMGQRILNLERQLVTGSKASANVDKIFRDEALANAPQKDQPIAKGKSVVDKGISILQGITKQKVKLNVRTRPQRSKRVENPMPSLAVVDSLDHSDSVTAIEKKPEAVTTRPKKKKTKAVAIKESLPIKKLTPFEQAEKLFIQGLDAEDVAKRCGLSLSEAALMQLVQRQQTQAVS